MPCVQNSLHAKHSKKSSEQGARASSMSLGCTFRNCIGKNSIWRNCTQRNRNPQGLQCIQLLFPFPLAPARPLHPLPLHHLLGGQCQTGRRLQGWRWWPLAAGGRRGRVCVLAAALARGRGLGPLRKGEGGCRGCAWGKNAKEKQIYVTLCCTQSGVKGCAGSTRCPRAHRTAMHTPCCAAGCLILLQQAGIRGAGVPRAGDRQQGGGVTRHQAGQGVQCGGMR